MIWDVSQEQMGHLIKNMKSRVEGSEQFGAFDELVDLSLFLSCCHAGN